jgi:hypothetical protein
MQTIHLVQQRPYEDWETIAHFDNATDAQALCDKLQHEHSLREQQFNNFRVYEIADNEINRNWYGVR